MHLSPLGVAAAATLILRLSPAQANVPDPLRDMVLSLRGAVSHELELGGTPCLTIRGHAQIPFLVWSRDGGPLPLPADPAEGAAWLAARGEALAHGSFTPAFARRFDWRGHEMQVFAFRHEGVELLDAEVWACFGEKGCIGLVNRVPQPMAPLPDRQEGIADPVYFVLRDAPARVVLASRERSQTPTHDVAEIKVGDRVVHRIMAQREAIIPPAAAAFREYTFPGSVFPDQIWADSRGRVWFSDPNANRVWVINPTTETALSYPTTGFSLPDGLSVDDQDRVWTGLYGIGHGLGKIDALTGAFTRYAPPAYPNRQMAIPTRTGVDTLLVSDHFAERVAEFDPKTNTWLRVLTYPASHYPVGGTLEAETGAVWFPLYLFNGLSRINPGQAPQNFATPLQAGPAFAVASDGKVWFSYWTADRLGEFDIATQTFTTHVLQANETGGPIDLAPNGHVILGTRNRGYIVDFDPLTRTFVAHPIPTTSPGLKDGLTVAPDGTIWFTESGRNKVAKLVLP
jgi:streptogramin lyase